MNKSMLITAITLGSLAISFPNKAEESKNSILTVDCKNDTQKSCVDAEIDKLIPSFKLCSAGELEDDVYLESFANKKFPQPTPPTDMIKQQKVDWISRVIKICKDEPTPQEIEKKNADFTEYSSWTNQFMVGYAIASAYEDDGTHKGLTEQSPLAQFSFDGRWLVGKKAPIHWEIGGFLASSPSFIDAEDSSSEVDVDPVEEAEVEVDAGDNTDTDVAADEDVTSVTKPTFNDVVGSLDVYTKLTTSFWNDDKGELKDYFAVGGIAGFKTRDKVADDLDAVVYYYGPILEYRYYGKDMRTNKNSIPRGKVWAGYLRFEEYGGLEDQDRLLLVGEWQLNDNEEAEPEEGRFVVGLKANLGEGADDVGIYFAYRTGFDSIQSFLTGK
ncbi:hypothetical protein [Paraglaciecola marina]|uniref:hypothetical protein n=1 Tax=Paraglaciecola marina TaxID=2500157 RepID=UPI00105BC118|nr:hypothetical protein [Paraglaciecola marina]